MPISGDFDYYLHGSLDTQDDIDVSSEEDFIKLIDTLVLQTLLYMQVKPNSVSEQETTLGFGTGKKGKDKKAENSFWKPIWIGKNYRIQSKKISGGAGTHASPKMPWRKGHWKRVSVGRREEDRREWRFIEPTLVNSEQD